MWMMPLHLHVNQKSDYDMMMMMMILWQATTVQTFRTFTFIYLRNKETQQTL